MTYIGFQPSHSAALQNHAHVAKSAALCFGRDAIFERNNALHEELERQGSGAASIPLRDVFEVTHGRVPQRTGLPNVLNQAKAEFTALRNDPQANLISQSLAGIRLANALLAEDKQNSDAFTLLKNSIAQLDEAGYNPTPGNAPTAYIHGLYNRGCYVLDHDLRQRNIEHYGRAKFAKEDAQFGGLLIPGLEDEDRQRLEYHLEQGLPFLERAVALSTGMQDQRLAHIEYLSAQGDMLHALSHLTHLNHETYNQQGLKAFQTALQTLDTIDAQHLTPQHHCLGKNLANTKMKHMQAPFHKVANAPSPDVAQVGQRWLKLDTASERNRMLIKCTILSEH